MPILHTPQGWILETRNTAYAFGINAAGLLVHRYWGVKLPRAADYPAAEVPQSEVSFVNPPHLSQEEFQAYGGLRYAEPAIKISTEQGIRDSVLSFVDSHLNGHILEIVLQDDLTGLQVTLHYRIDEQADLIERWTTLKNTGSQTLTIERVFSAMWHLPAGETYCLTHLSGQWLDEFRIQKDVLQEGSKILESRTLTTSHLHHPFFAVDRADETASETHGEVWFGLLAWSGNFKLVAEKTNAHQTRLLLGVNDWDFEWTLKPGESFETPTSLAGYTNQGFGAASRNLHQHLRGQLPHPGLTRKVLYNSWEATTFDVTVEGQSALAEVAARMGIELFVMDDGWFQGRHQDTAALGDWWPDAQKFPDGLNPLIEKVKGLGMDFGLWVEPEMVNPNSTLYRAHPDWVYHFEGRARNEARNQLILNLGRTDVQDHLIALLDDLLSKHDISFIKWDFNRYVSEPGWPSFAGNPKELWVRHVQGLYRVWGTLREKHPAVVWQTCSGGGGRADAGMLRIADQAWISDCTDPAARLQIQEGYSLVYPANTMEAWATDWGKDRFSLEFRFHAAMCGVLGIGGHILHWSEAEKTEAANLIQQYKGIRHIIHQGDLYRLRSPSQHPISAVQYVSQDQRESVVFTFKTHVSRYYQPAPTLKLQGLDPRGTYQLGDEVRSGLAWMERGLDVKLQDFQSQVLLLRRVE
ncbi:alpha-galactosidase [Deinococcus roseus]|uniref:Alpha-galactosidase n=1 Tax=Deinococcus roseus TaxID=392414 RepID=A0ABQ2DCV3_9DEIO|nr:alpha-galactosidase [Deinococcus roseus]GGJ53719.1 alpha-galactosidase [Deinococcus roseus]